MKGVLTAEDAEIATGLGVAGILVSNHGARQIDGVPASVRIENKYSVFIHATNNTIF